MKVKVWLFKTNETFYCEEEVELPTNVVRPDTIKEFVKEKLKGYKNKIIVIPMQEDFIE